MSYTFCLELELVDLGRGLPPSVFCNADTSAPSPITLPFWITEYGPTREFLPILIGRKLKTPFLTSWLWISAPSAITAPSPIDTRDGSVMSTVSSKTDDPILAPNITNQYFKNTVPLKCTANTSEETF